MCGRYLLISRPERLAKAFGARIGGEIAPRYNIAPTQLVPAVRVDAETGVRKLDMLRWGLIPSWATDPQIGNRMINARAESAGKKPSFRDAMRYRRCLIPADGFYEWKTMPRGRKQPYLVQMADEQPFALAGLWERWRGSEDEVVESCTVLTTEANEMVATIHNRMPVIVRPMDYARWLDPAEQAPEQLRDIFEPYPVEEMMCRPVSAHVNDPKHEDAQCIEPTSLF
jgi:putative SOS response-associated peptidase YedK